jgi:hypothetical protein
MRKRQKMVLAAVVLSAGFLAVSSSSLDLRYWLILGLSLATWLLTGWSLREGLSGWEWLTALLPSVLFTAAVALFYILLPESWLSRLAILLMFGLGQYALLLSGNIFSVAAIRTIALFRAASAVGFVMTLLTAFFLYNTILSFRLIFWQTGLAVVLASFLLLFSALWSVELENKISGKLLRYSGVLAVVMGYFAVAISFWPISVAVASLFFCTMLYVLMGVVQHHFVQRLFPRTIWEYVTVGTVVTITMLLTAGWGV